MVVTVLKSGKTRDLYLAACASNIWYIASLDAIYLCYIHVRGENNGLADMLSRWAGSDANWQALCVSSKFLLILYAYNYMYLC